MLEVAAWAFIAFVLYARWRDESRTTDTTTEES